MRLRKKTRVQGGEGDCGSAASSPRRLTGNVVQLPPTWLRPGEAVRVSAAAFGDKVVRLAKAGCRPGESPACAAAAICGGSHWQAAWLQPRILMSASPGWA